MLSVYVLFSNHIFMFYLVINLYKGLCVVLGGRGGGGGGWRGWLKFFKKGVGVDFYIKKEGGFAVK